MKSRQERKNDRPSAPDAHSFLKELREREGFTIAELAARSGVDDGTVYKAERSSRNGVKIDTLMRVYKTLTKDREEWSKVLAHYVVSRAEETVDWESVSSLIETRLGSNEQEIERDLRELVKLLVHADADTRRIVIRFTGMALKSPGTLDFARLWLRQSAD